MARKKPKPQPPTPPPPAEPPVVSRLPEVLPPELQWNPAPPPPLHERHPSPPLLRELVREGRALGPRLLTGIDVEEAVGLVHEVFGRIEAERHAHAWECDATREDGWTVETAGWPGRVTEALSRFAEVFDPLARDFDARAEEWERHWERVEKDEEDEAAIVAEREALEHQDDEAAGRVAGTAGLLAALIEVLDRAVIVDEPIVGTRTELRELLGKSANYTGLLERLKAKGEIRRLEYLGTDDRAPAVVWMADPERHEELLMRHLKRQGEGKRGLEEPSNSYNQYRIP